MYKVFVNEKKISFSKSKDATQKSIRFEDSSSFEIALDQLQNTSCKEITIYGEDLDKIWEHFTKKFKVVKSSGGVVENEEKEILFIKRLGKWDLPKGKIETGESLEEAAIREVEEETSLQNVNLNHFITTTYHMYTERNNELILKFTYWFKMETSGIQKIKPQTEEGITSVDWKNSDSIVNEVFKNTFHNIRMVLEQVMTASK